MSGLDQVEKAVIAGYLVAVEISPQVMDDDWSRTGLLYHHHVANGGRCVEVSRTGRSPSHFMFPSES